MPLCPRQIFAANLLPSPWVPVGLLGGRPPGLAADTSISFYQEIIKVRECFPHIGPLTKVIRLKLFLDIVPSSSEDITRAMGGQPKRLSRIFNSRKGQRTNQKYRNLVGSDQQMQRLA